MRINFYNKKLIFFGKNVQVDSSLSVTTFSGLKLMKLLEFYENFHVLATCLTPKHEKWNVLQKKQSRLEVAFRQNRSLCLKKHVFFQNIWKSVSFGESREPGVFLCLENQAISSCKTPLSVHCTRTSHHPLVLPL